MEPEENPTLVCYALVYKYDSKTVRPHLDDLKGAKWRAPQRPGPVNLLVRAELPTAPPNGSHNGFQGILNLLGYSPCDLHMNPKYADCKVGPDTTLALHIKGVHGILPEEEYFLAESCPDCPVDLPGTDQHCKPAPKTVRPGLLLQPANCSSIHGIFGHEDRSKAASRK